MNFSLFNPEYDGTTFTISGSQTGVLVLHGFTATTLEVREFAEKINSHFGYTVHAPLLPGHGTSLNDLAKTNYHEWLEAADAAFNFLRERLNHIWVAGESMGGLLSLNLATQNADISGILVYAPALIVPEMRMARLMKRFIFSTAKDLHPTLPGFLPWQGYLRNPLKAVSQLGDLQIFIKKRLCLIRQPVLAFQGLKDETIDLQSSRKVIEMVSSNIKELIELENCRHCILLDAQREFVYQKTFDFIHRIENDC